MNFSEWCLSSRGVIHMYIPKAFEMNDRSTIVKYFQQTSVEEIEVPKDSVGFKHVHVEQIGPMPYVRADVFMELELK